MTALTAMAIESSTICPEIAWDISGKWKEQKGKAIRKNMLLDAERAEILRFLESESIWYLPLKGSVLKDLYPKYGMREMADNDILIDPAGREKIFAFMSERGYTGTSGRGLGHDTYQKPPVYNFELHPVLVSKSSDPVWYAYYETVKERLEPDADSRYGYHFHDEDFYLYMTVHACKHYRNAGTGLRTLADAYVFLGQKGEGLDWDYIGQEARKLGIDAFENQLRQLAQRLFADPGQLDDAVLTDEEERMLTVLSGSGTYGTYSNLVANQLSQMETAGASTPKKDKLRYLWNRLFPNMEWFENNAPFFAKHRILIPFFWIYRIFRGVLCRGKAIRCELRAVRAFGRQERK